VADEVLRIDQQRFREGRGTSSDLLLSEESVLRAKTDLAAIMADSQIAAAALKLATGELDAPAK
jgi:outer membrane protein TolC